nr:EAL domain-containing protein [Oceanococcus sp. HetDA_MAG_MS8]
MVDEKLNTSTHGSGPRLLPVWVLCWVLGLAGLSAWWFLVYLSNQLNEAQDQQQAELQAAAQLLESRLNSAELISDLLSATARNRANGPAPNTILAQDAAPLAESGLIAVGWWPANSRRPVGYYFLSDGAWRSSAQSQQIERVPTQAAWYALAPTLAATRCLWSSVESELQTQQPVISCTRAVFNAQGIWQGTLRLSFATALIYEDLPSRHGLIVSNAAGEVLHASAEGRSLSSRNLASMSQQRQEWSQILTHLYLNDEQSLRQHSERNDPQPELIQDLLRRGIDGSEDRARQRLSTHTIDSQKLISHAQCTASWCVVSQALPRVPWRLSLMYPVPSTAPIAFDPREHMPLWAGLAALSASLILFTLIASIRLSRPLSRLGNQLDRANPLPDFDETLPGHWGRIAATLNQLLESNRELRLRGMQPQKGTQPKDNAAGETWLHQLPMAALIIGRDGNIRHINAAAQTLLQAQANQPANTISLRLGSQSTPVALDELPDNCREHHCELLSRSQPTSLLLSTAKTNGATETLILLQAQQAQSAQPATVLPPPQTRREHMRAHLAQLTAPARWVYLRARPAEGSLNVADTEAFADFYAQVEGRISERLEEQEYLLNKGAGQYVVYSAQGLSTQRKVQLVQGLESALVFCSGQRVRLLLDSQEISVAPGHREEDLDAAVFQLLHPADGAQRLRSHSAAQWDALIQSGFEQHRFQLITEHAQSLRGDAADGGVFRVIPHLEDEEGFWLDADDFMPVVDRLGRRAELDIWLIEEVRKALTQVTDTPPAEVILPLSAKSLLENDNTVAEQLLSLTQSAGPSPIQILISIRLQEIQALQSDPRRLQQMVRSLRCEMLLDQVGLNLEAMSIMEALKPHSISVSAQLMRQAQDSQAAAIGMEAIFRAADSQKARSILLDVDSANMQQHAEKLGADLAFGSAIGRPSPILFKAVA